MLSACLESFNIAQPSSFSSNYFQPRFFYFPFELGGQSLQQSHSLFWMRERISIYWNSTPIFTHQFLNSDLSSFIAYEKNNISITTFLSLAWQIRLEACSIWFSVSLERKGTTVPI